MNEQKDVRKNFFTLRSGFIFLFAFLLFLTVYFFLELRKTKALIDNPKELARVEAQKITEKLSKFMDLPKEQASIATVTDKNKVKSQSFFSRAENGDKVLIFRKAKKAILYRPSTGRIIEFAPVDFQEDDIPKFEQQTIPRE